jgi:hypothetical protein
MQKDHEQSESLRLGGNFIIPGYTMISGVGVALACNRKYFLHIGKSKRRWVVSATDENQGEHIYLDGGRGSQGFGGRLMRFQLAPWGYVEFEGPWHSNATDFFRDTGIDVRNKFHTFGVIGRRCLSAIDNSGRKRDLIEDVLYFDSAPVLGSFNRIRELAQKMADELGVSVYCYDSSLGGSSQGYRYPSEKTKLSA